MNFCRSTIKINFNFLWKGSAISNISSYVDSQISNFGMWPANLQVKTYSGDCNDITKTCIYFTDSASNLPANEQYGYLTTIVYNNTYVKQTYTPYSALASWERIKDGFNWGSWRRLGYQYVSFDSSAVTSLRSGVSIGSYCRGRITDTMVILHLQFSVTSTVPAWTWVLQIALPTGMINYAESFGTCWNYSNGECIDVYFPGGDNRMQTVASAMSTGEWRGDLILFQAGNNL